MLSTPPFVLVEKIRLIALSCDRPRRLMEGDENPWDRISEECTQDKCDVMLHLGDQVTLPWVAFWSAPK